MEEFMLYNNRTLKEEEISFGLYRTINMCTFIKMEYLVANALVELYDKKGVDRISLEQIQRYGIKVEEELNSKENTRAILLYSNVNKYCIFKNTERRILWKKHYLLF